MPYSAGENSLAVTKWVIDNNIKTVLDVGAGAGLYSDILRPHVDNMTAIEVWEPYIIEFKLKEKYDAVYRVDVRSLSATDLPEFDLVIFGDILEHMTHEEALTVWETASKIAKWGLISVPIVHYPQGAEHGNPYEVHVQEHLHPEDLREAFGPFDEEWIYDVTGTFLKRF